MKQFLRNIYLTFCGFLLLGSHVFSLNLKNSDVPPQHLVVDQTSDPTLHHVIRRNPTYTRESSRLETPVYAKPSDTMEFSNTNDNNGYNVPNPEYGTAAELANPAIYVHSKGKLSVIQEQPAHVGWREEKKVITTLNKNTSKIVINVIFR